MFVIGPMMHKTLTQLIDRENDREALKTILRCIQILKEDKASVAVFPEGGIIEDYKLHHFRPGVFKIAQKAKVPIVVCTLKNTDHVMENVVHYRRSDVQLNLVTVIQPEEFAGITTVELAQRVHKIMADDLGPELVAEN
jgi:1-acyl-sn-glycerol-3-phosphate acyltransferase